MLPTSPSGGIARPLIQLSCAGELGINLISNNLQFGVHMPYLQVGLGWIACTLRCLVDRALVASPPLPARPPAHAPPHTQDFIAFVAERARVLQETRRAYWQGQPGAPGPPGYILTPFQFEIRYMVHHAAHWLYQYTWFGAETCAVPTS